MRWGLHGRTGYLMHYGFIEWPRKHHLGCHHTNLSTERLPVELEFKAHWAIKRWNMDLEAAGTKREDATL